MNGKSKEHITRSQKRKDKRKYFRVGDELKQMLPSREKLIELQEADEDIQKLVRNTSDQFFKREDLILRRWVPRNTVKELEQLVLPKLCRTLAMKVAHSIPLAGHMGRDKTARRLYARFYWPTLFRDVAEYCRTCPECQHSSSRNRVRVPLIPLPIMGKPFQRIAMDVVGPLPKSKRYILVICDYATRFPEAIPMCSVNAEAVVEELVNVFSRFGIPTEVLWDQ